MIYTHRCSCCSLRCQARPAAQGRKLHYVLGTAAGSVPGQQHSCYLRWAQAERRLACRWTRKPELTAAGPCTCRPAASSPPFTHSGALHVVHIQAVAPPLRSLRLLASIRRPKGRRIGCTGHKHAPNQPHILQLKAHLDHPPQHTKPQP